MWPLTFDITLDDHPGYQLWCGYVFLAGTPIMLIYIYRFGNTGNAEQYFSWFLLFENWGIFINRTRVRCCYMYLIYVNCRTPLFNHINRLVKFYSTMETYWACIWAKYIFNSEKCLCMCKYTKILCIDNNLLCKRLWCKKCSYRWDKCDQKLVDLGLNYLPNPCHFMISRPEVCTCCS